MDERLAGSSHFIEDWGLCRVSLKNDKNWPWLYLVPMRDGVSEIHELSPEDCALLADEIAFAGAAIKKLYNADKINTAAFGNMVPQLHIHVFGRYKTDAAWPGAVWSVQTAEIPYTVDEKNTEIQKLKNCFAEMRGDKTACQQ
ncbi:MAG: HIT domain-containing protein [Alphaproteobacteria bacterium]|nr:HIT domain-containing protein [Alphaproteobacteria bacterium]